MAANAWVERKLAEHNMSLRELGRRSGLSQGSISNALNNKKETSLDFYVKLAQVFDDVPGLLQAMELLPTEEAIKGSLIQLFKLVRSLSPEAQQEVSNYIDYVIQKQRREQEASGKNDLAADSG